MQMRLNKLLRGSPQDLIDRVNRYVEMSNKNGDSEDMESNPVRLGSLTLALL